MFDASDTDAAQIVRLTNSFVRTYSRYGAELAPGAVPNPAVFRADALSLFETHFSYDGSLKTGVVGLPGREIKEVASDQSMRQHLLDLEANKDQNSISSLILTNGTSTHRSLWAFCASEQACADCHNRIQNLTGDAKWKVGDLMGAQVVEQDVSRSLASVKRYATINSILVFFTVLAAWFCIVYLLRHFSSTRKLKTLATTDPLTGCINRREFQNRVNELSGLVSGAVLMLDLDEFKSINDTYGHDVGDDILQDFTTRLQSVVRENDLVARFGGEEFVVWLSGAKPVDAIRIAERLRRETECAEVQTSEGLVSYTVSIGLRVIEKEHASQFERWIKAADKLVYRAKNEGRNRIICGALQPG